jgi:hypothetical protein
MGPYAFFHVAILFRHFRDDAVLLGDRGFELGDAGAIGQDGLGLAALRAPILQRRRQVLQRLPLPEVEQAGCDLVFVTEIRDRDLVAQVATQDRGLLLGLKDLTRALDGFLRGTHDNLRCSIVWSRWCHISTGAGQREWRQLDHRRRLGTDLDPARIVVPRSPSAISAQARLLD